MSDRLSPRAQKIVDAARTADDPSATDRDRVRASVFAAIAAGGAAPSSSPTAGQGAAASTIGGKLLLATSIAAVAVAVGAGYLALRGNDSIEEASLPELVSSPQPVPALQRSAAPMATAPEPAPAFEQPDEVDEPTMEFEPKPVEVEPAPARPQSTLQQERELLSRARDARRDGKPADALRMLDQFARQFAGGVLLEERAAERVVVLCDLGRLPQARAEANRFRTRWPDSVHANRVDSSCAAAPAE